MNSGKLVLGILAGVAAGAAMGILFAPDKGSKTRKQILNKSEDYVDEVKEKLDELLNTMTEKYESIRNDADGLIAKGKTKYNEVKKEVSNPIA